MNHRAPRGRIDLSFLHEEEAQQIFQVLERDAQLKKAERERISKLDKKKEEATGLPGVTGEWFEEIQKRKFQNDLDVSRMFKQPLAHRLRKAIGNDSTSTKPSSSQKHGSPSILGGLRTPFASLFSSFRKSKRHQQPKPQQNSQECSPRYDHFAAGAHMSSRPEEMAKTEIFDSLLPSEPTKKGFEASPAEMLEDSTCTWNEQLENELLRVLGSLDDQLAREQSQDPVNRRTPIHYDSRTSELSHYPTVPPHGVPGGLQRKNQSMFLSDGPRTLRAKDEPRALSRSRVFYDTYMKRHHAADYTYGDTYDRRSPALRRGHSSRSLGHSSEGSLQLNSGPYASGFGHKDFAAVNRSCSLSCLSRGQSLASVDQLSTATLHYPLENNRGFTQRNYHQQTKRTPLSSIVWNAPQSPENSPYADKLLRTQSLMEFGPTFEETRPCSPQENAGYEFYRSRDYYRRGVPNTTHSMFPNQHVDPLYSDSRDNYGLHQMERNSSKSCYRYPSFHGRRDLPRRSFPSGRTEEQRFRPDSHQYYSDEVFLASDADCERIPSNRDIWPNVGMKKSGLRIWEHDSQDHSWGIDPPEGVTNRLFSKHPNGLQRHRAYGLYVPKSQTTHAVQHNLHTGISQNPSTTFAKHFQTNENPQICPSEEVRNPDRFQSGKMESEHSKGEEVRLVLGQRDVTSPSESPMNSSSAPLVRKSTKLTSIRNIENMYLSNIRKREGQRNQRDCAVNSDLDQMPLSYLIAKSTRAVNQNSQQERHPVENLGAVINNNKTSENSCSAVFSKGPEVLKHDALPCSRTESLHKYNRVVKQGASNSIAGSPSKSPPDSPPKYYTLPRKSPSIDVSVLSEKPLPQLRPTAEIPCKNKTNVEDCLVSLGSSKIENLYSKTSDKITMVPTQPSLSPSSKDFIGNEIPPTKDNHLHLTQDSKHSFDDISALASKLEKQALCDSDRAEISVSECEETCTKNPLAQYKTTSTVTVSIEQDNVKYHELISVYYTLPRKHSRALCNLFLDDTNVDADSSPPRKSPSHQKKYVHTHLATVAFSSSSEKEEKGDSLGKIAVAPDVQPNSKASSGAIKEGIHIPNTAAEGAATILPPSTVLNKDEAAPTEGPEFSKRRVSLGFLSEPKTSRNKDDSLSGVINTSGDQHIDRYPPPLNQGSNGDTFLNFQLSNATEDKISSGNLVATSPARTAVKRSPRLFSLPTESVSDNSSHIPPSCRVGTNKEGKHADSGITTTINYTKESIGQDTEIKEKLCHGYHMSSRKADELQLKKANVRSARKETLTSDTNVCSDFQKENPPVDVASTVNSIFQANKTASDYRKTAQVEKPQNSVIHKVCKNSQRSVTNSTDNQDSNSKDQLKSTIQGRSEDPASENKPISDGTKDKMSDIEKRKNRPSIKNKLAAIYKTSRKFSSKKSLTLKPHISNIFSQNDTHLSENSNSHDMLISSDTPQVVLQTGNENQNLNVLADDFDNIARDRPENKKSETNAAPSWITNENRRPFANLCNQKNESPSPRLSDKKPGGKQHSTVLFPKEIMPELSLNSQMYDKGLANKNQPTFSRITHSDLNQKKESGSNVSGLAFSPLSSAKSSKILTTNYPKATVCSPQEVISPTESDHYQNIKRSNRLRNPNLSCVEPVLNSSKTPRERHFSESSYTRVSHDCLSSSAGNMIQSGSRYNRKFKSQSELLSCDENEKWDACADSSRAFGSRQVMYPSIEFGIFGKEQQQAFLDNIKRSLTEGRLWRPYLLSNPRSLRKEGNISLSRPELLSSGFAERRVSAEETSEFQGQGSADYSDTNSDTTTDDEYYLDGNDKESEL